MEPRLLGIEGAVGRCEVSLRDELGRGREETREASRSLREEVAGLFERLSGALRASLSDLSTGQQARLDDFANRLGEASTRQAEDARSLREEIQHTLAQLGESVGARMSELGAAHVRKFDTVTAQIAALTDGNERRQEILRANIEARLGALKTEAGLNAKALREEISINLQNLGNAINQTLDHE